MSNKVVAAIVIAAVVLVALFIAFVVVPAMHSGYQFRDTALNASREILTDLDAHRTPLHVDNTDQAELLGVVGLVLIVEDEGGAKQRTQPFNRANALPDYRPPVESVAVVPLGTVRYQGKISNKLAAGGSFTGFAADMSDDQTAEVLIKDEMYLGFRDRRKIPYEELRKLPREVGKKYFFVEGATLSSTTWRTFKQVSSGATLDGTAFKAQGKVFASNDTFAYQPTLSIEVFEIAPLHPPTGGASQDRIKVLSWLSQHRSGQLDEKNANALVDVLKKMTTEDSRRLSGAHIAVPR